MQTKNAIWECEENKLTEIFNLFAKENKLSILLFGKSCQDLRDLKGSQVFVVFPTHIHMNATVSPHGKGSTDGLLS